MCLKCGEQHETAQCGKSKDIPAKCITCGGNHPANNTECPIYKKLEEKIRIAKTLAREKETAQRTRYISAPFPSTNAWPKLQQVHRAPATRRDITTQPTEVNWTSTVSESQPDFMEYQVITQ